MVVVAVFRLGWCCFFACEKDIAAEDEVDGGVCCDEDVDMCAVVGAFRCVDLDRDVFVWIALEDRRWQIW